MLKFMKHNTASCYLYVDLHDFDPSNAFGTLNLYE